MTVRPAKAVKATAVARASGRVNLIGEHTDYNDGYVLPAVIPQGIVVRLEAREGSTVRVATDADVGGRVEAGEGESFVVGDEKPTGTWLDYVQGVTAILGREGHAIGGFDARIDSTLPYGAGLSSSAALIVGVMRGVRELFGLDLGDVAMALLAQKVENDFVGARVGIMDQMAVCLAKPGYALFLDTRDLSYQHVEIPAACELFIIDSGVRHSLVSSEYNTRRDECAAACAALGIVSLRDMAVADLGRLAPLPPVLARRARHVVTENARVVRAVAALRASDPETVGALFYASHASMRDDYEVSVPEIDSLVALASADGSVFGARLTGGGFGGSIVGLARPGEAADAARRIAAAYEASRSRRATVLLPVTEGGGPRRRGCRSERTASERS